MLSSGYHSDTFESGWKVNEIYWYTSIKAHNQATSHGGCNLVYSGCFTL